MIGLYLMDSNFLNRLLLASHRPTSKIVGMVYFCRTSIELIHLVISETVL